MENLAIYSAGTPPNAAELFKEIAQDAKKRRRAKTPIKSTKKRQGKGGKTFTYIDKGYVEQWLDEHFPAWSFEADSASIHNVGNHIHVAATLTVLERGIIRRVKRYGAKEAIPNSSGSLVEHPYLKSAETDALKRCAAALGCAFDIYGSELDDSVPTATNAIVDVEDLRWFACAVCTVASELPPDKVSKIPTQFIALQQCKISKQQIIDNYAKQGFVLRP